MDGTHAAIHSLASGNSSSVRGLTAVHDLRSTLRVGIDANSILGDRGGVRWYTYLLLRALVELKQDVEIVAFRLPLCGVDP